MSDARHIFSKALSRQHVVWRAGMIACALAGVLRAALLLGIVYGLVDFLLSFSVEARVILSIALAGTLAVLLVWDMIETISLSRKELADRADRASTSARRPILSAFELQPETEGESGLHRFLVEKALADAAAVLRKTPSRFLWPRDRFHRHTRMLLLAALLGVALFGVHPSASRVVLDRMIHPRMDIPPYSPLEFHITPKPAKVLYGGTVELRAGISGAAIRGPVHLLTRKAGHTDRTVCFRESPAQFSQRLEKVVDPLEFCFAAGKARSRWEPLDVLLQPKIATVRATVEPPAYTRLPRMQSMQGTDTIEGFKGSRVQLEVTSNRPLSKGALTVAPLSGIEHARIVKAEKTGPHTVTFEWQLNHAARLEMRIEDVRGTHLAEPLQLVQKIIPDEPPEVAIHTPTAYALATPGSVVAVQGSASDDLALRNVELVRTVVGFRDRTAPLALPLPEKRFSFSSDLKLGQLGVLPGQIIELYLEARDFNPDRTGIGVSDIARIEIISDGEYAEMIRANETIDQFLARYQAVTGQLEEFRKLADELAREMAQAAPDRAKIAGLLDRAREHNRQSQALFSKLASEFQAYAIEAQLSDALKEIAARLEGHGTLLWGMTPDSPQLAGAVQRLRKDLQLDEQRMREQLAGADEIARVARVMEHAAEFNRIISRQRQLVRQLQRFESASPPNAGELAYYGTQQSGILDSLKAFVESLPKAAAQLPDDDAYAKLRQSAIEFAEKVKESGAAQSMQEAIGATANQDGVTAHQRARLALERLEALLSKCQGEGSPFAGLCKDELRFSVRDELNQSLAQMLAAMLRGGGTGSGRLQGVAGGGQGDGEDGFSVPANTRLNTPVFGPPRSAFRPGGAAQGGSGQGAIGNSEMIQKDAREVVGDARQTEKPGRTRDPEFTPDKYRDAVKRYFDQLQPTQ